MSTLKMISIGELEQRGEAALQTGPFGTQLKASDYTPEGTPVINVRNIGFGSLREDHLEYLPEGKAAKLWQHHLKTGDIVFGRKGAVERHALIDKHSHGWIQGSDCMRLRIASSTVCGKYLSYYLRTAAHQDWMQALCSFGATMSSLNQDILRRLTFPSPPLATQQKIAAILSAYDDLIANNQRRITLLERMAEDIYREWFVRLRFPGHEQAKIEKGVPQGWKVLPFSKVVNVNPRERTNSSIPVPFVPMDELSTTQMYFEVNEYRQQASGAKFRNHDVLFPRITPSLENGKRGYVLTLPDDTVGIGSTEFIVFREQTISSEHIYFLTCCAEFRRHAELSMTGASGRQRVSEECFGFFLVKVPPNDLRDRFKAVVSPYFTQIRVLSTLLNKLKTTRDALLPRLISGKLAVDELDIRFPPSMASPQETQ